MQNNIKNQASIKNTIIFFNNQGNLRILRPSFDDFYSAVDMMYSHKLDFDDGLVVACMKNYGIGKLVSFDRHFDRVTGIERIKF